MCIGLHVNTHCACQTLNRHEFSGQIFEKYPSIKFQENPPSESRVVQYGRTEGQTDMTKILDSFRSFTNVPNKYIYAAHSLFVLCGTRNKHGLLLHTALTGMFLWPSHSVFTRVGTLIVATIYLQLIQNRYMFRSFTVLQCSHQRCVQPVASDVEVAGYF